MSQISPLCLLSRVLLVNLYFLVLWGALYYEELPSEGDLPIISWLRRYSVLIVFLIGVIGSILYLIYFNDCKK